MYQNLILFHSATQHGPNSFLPHKDATTLIHHVHQWGQRNPRPARSFPSTNIKVNLLLSLHNMTEPREFLQSHAGIMESRSCPQTIPSDVECLTSWMVLQAQYLGGFSVS